MHTGIFFLTPSRACLPVHSDLRTALILPPLRLPVDFSPRDECVHLSRIYKRIETMDHTNSLRLALLVRLQHTHARQFLLPSTMPCRACPCTPTSIPSNFASALPPITVLINGRDEPRVVFDVRPLVEDPPTLAQALTLSDPTSFTLSPPRTGAFFAQPERNDVCRPARGVGGVGDVPFLVSASSAEFTTDLVPVLSMTKLSDVSTGGGAEGGRGSCFVEVLVPGEMRDSIPVDFIRWGFLGGSENGSTVYGRCLWGARLYWEPSALVSMERTRLFFVFGVLFKS
ncbi:hypothetical protein B0H13DRAFT_2662711, partial [Mycena leptocephala]